jgi:hypothetical protein
MGWETRRNGKQYYYEKEREGDKVVSRYIGAGRLAPLVAEINQLRQERRQQQRWEAAITRDEFSELAATPEDLTLLLEQARSATAAALVDAGYHQHKRQWRKKRVTNKNQDQDQSTASE